MEKLKKYKRIIIGIIIGSVLTGGICGYAAYNYMASDITYIKDGTEMKVSEALNELYNESSNYIKPKGTLNITSNGENIDVSQYERVNVTINMDGAKNLLWTNSTPNSSREAFDIELNSSIENFSYILVEYKIKTTSSDICKDLFETRPYRLGNSGNDSKSYCIGCYNGDHGMVRHIKYKDSTTLRCGNCVKTDGTMNNNWIIPLNVYGINI